MAIHTCECKTLSNHITVSCNIRKKYNNLFLAENVHLQIQWTGKIELNRSAKSKILSCPVVNNLE